MIPAALRRGGWAMADQGVSSVSNMLLTVLVARQVGAAEFGSFALLYGYYVVAVEVSRAVCSEPLLVRVPGGDARRVLAASSGTAMCCAVPFAVALPVFAVLLDGTRAAFVLAVALPVLLAQDALRMGFIACGRPRRALACDVVWMAVQCGLMMTASTLPALVAAWGAGAAVSVAVARVLPRPGAFRSWWGAYGDLARPYAAETSALAAAGYGVLVAVGAFAGPAAAGALRAAQTLFGPVNVLLSAGRAVAINELSRLDPGRRPRAALAVSAALGGTALLAGTAAALIPEPLGLALFAAVWTLAAPVVGPVAADRVLAALAVGPNSALRAGEAVRELFALRLSTAAAGVAFGAAGAALAGAPGAAAGLAAASALNCLTAGFLLWHRRPVLIIGGAR